MEILTSNSLKIGGGEVEAVDAKDSGQGLLHFRHKVLVFVFNLLELLIEKTDQICESRHHLDKCAFHVRNMIGDVIFKVGGEHVG